MSRWVANLLLCGILALMVLLAIGFNSQKRRLEALDADISNLANALNTPAQHGR